MEEAGADGRTEMCGATGESSRRNPTVYPDGAPNPTATRAEPSQEYGCLLEAVVERENMKRALQRVKSNRGSAGVDNMTLAELSGYLKTEWPQIKEDLLDG